MFQHAQLLQRFRQLERCGRQLSQLQEELPSIDVQADMFEGARGDGTGRRRIPDERDERAGKIERESLLVDHHLDDVGIASLLGILESPPEGRHEQVRIGDKRSHRLVNCVGIEQRLIALDVDDQAAVEPRRDLGESIGAGTVRHARQAHGPAKPPHDFSNPLVVGGDDHEVHSAARGGPAIHVLDHRSSGKVRERFARKTSGPVAGGDDGDSGNVCWGPVENTIGATEGTHAEW